MSENVIDVAGSEDLLRLVRSQVEHNFLLTDEESGLLAKVLPVALDRCAACFSDITFKHYEKRNGVPVFNPYHSAQYTVFLYHLSRIVGMANRTSALAAKLYCLNKMLSGADIYYEVELPPVMYFEHPVGSVLGRARYGNHLIVQQGCTVGGNRGKYPVMGDFVWMFAQSMIIGDCSIGNHVFVSAGCHIKDTSIPDNSLVFGQSPNLVIKSRPAEYFLERSPFVAHGKQS